ncbi:hypothetical protein [Nitrososphaeria virus YSH_1032793]|uniref:Uncharacterized protein n=1 Tax=Nitrososphaeria virus YSH_1032793 TaxID=3071320 RepID=A0A976UAB2_9CAUD|nr:hypothetical protein QKV91_gp16 [Yangshan Harbor Nitrososphaeria virus]UVF62220.1 hypothetical protein [Nitrososphaeria virus YSH_1032793]
MTLIDSGALQTFIRKQRTLAFNQFLEIAGIEGLKYIQGRIRTFDLILEEIQRLEKCQK